MANDRGQNFPGDWFGRKAVCRRCGWVMNDCEPMSGHGEFYHSAPKEKRKAFRCQNRGKCMTIRDADLMPFLPKKERRRLKREKQNV